MAEKRRARVVARELVGPRAVRLDLRMEEPEVLPFVGGQYVIAETGVIVDDKPIKRAYSLASFDRDSRVLSLVVHRHGEGQGSNALASRAVGDAITFSGPWGKMVPRADEGTRSLVVATAIGITAAIGLLRGMVMSRRVRPPRLVIVSREGDAEPVVHLETLERMLADTGVVLAFLSCDSFSEASAKTLADQIFAETFDEAFFVGSGQMNLALAARAVERGIARESVFVEHFFDKPQAGARSVA